MRKGISIVALVITIIVLIILTATVIISMQDESNILAKANKAVSRNNEATAQEKVIMEISNVKVPASELGQNVYEYFFDEENGYDRREELEKKGMHIQKGDQANTLDIEVNEYVVNVNSNGDVQEVFFSTEKRLPNEYQAVEYIQGTGIQYIMTDYHPDKNGMLVEYKANWQAAGMIVSSHAKSSPYGRNNGYLYQKMTWELGYGEVCPTSKETGEFNKDYIIEFSTINTKPAYLKVDGKEVVTIPEKQYVSTGNLYLFSNDWQKVSGATKGTKAKLYYAKVWNTENVLVCDFVPCYKKEGKVLGVYDLVNDKFYTNSGTGNFNIGNEIK